MNDNERVIVNRIAEKYRLDPIGFMACIDVESGGSTGTIINGRFEPLIRYEGHYFDKLCKASVREAARKAGVSSPKAGVIKNPDSQSNRWLLVQKAAKYDAVAAYESCSYGVGQVMGSHWKDLGFKSIQSFVERARDGFEGQCELMALFIIKNNIGDALNKRDWSRYARVYNGSKYKKNRYDEKLQQAYVKFGGSKSTCVTVSGYLRLGSKGAGVRDLQAMLVLAGYDLNIDGDFGIATNRAVKDFQSVNDLVEDGIVGPATNRELTKIRDKAPADAGQKPATSLPEVQQGVGVSFGVPVLITAVQDKINEAVTYINKVSFLEPLANVLHAAVGLVMVVSVIGGIVYAIKGWRAYNSSYTGSKGLDINGKNTTEEDSVYIPERIRI